MPEIVPGLTYYPTYLDRSAQIALADSIAAILSAAPPFVPAMPRTGKPFSVRMSNCGPLGWVSDIKGYRYQATHPGTEATWPAMPPALLDAWQTLAGSPPRRKPA